MVALRKESVDRNMVASLLAVGRARSLSARRAWIEILVPFDGPGWEVSLSARRAWIEILISARQVCLACVALRKESVDRNLQNC